MASSLLSASISTASSGATAVVAAASGRRIRVVSYVLVAAGAVTAKWQSASTDLTGAMSLITGTPLAPAPFPQRHSGGYDGHIQTAPGEALNLTLGGAVQVSGHLTYVLD